MASAKTKIRHVFGDTFSCRAAPPDILVKLSAVDSDLKLDFNIEIKPTVCRFKICIWRDKPTVLGMDH